MRYADMFGNSHSPNAVGDMDQSVKRIEGTVLVACWLMTCSTLALVRLVSASGDIGVHTGAWKAAAGPLIMALLSLEAARRLLRDRRTVLLPTAVLCTQLLALSAGSLAYRLDVGPFLRLGFSTLGMGTDIGSDARLLFIIGPDNRVPTGLAVNVLALAGLAILFSAHRATLDSAT